MGDPTSKITLNETLRAVNTSIVEGLGQLASYFGFSKVMGQLFGALMLSPDPLSLDDLMNLLGISKASVSTNMRTLEHMGIVREVWVKDDRRKYYRAERDFWRILTNILKQPRAPRCQPGAPRTGRQCRSVAACYSGDARGRAQAG